MMNDNKLAEYCPICREVFNDPIMISDGFCYCRDCISKWVDGCKQWTSPLTNRLHYGWALLTQDLLRAGASLEYHRRCLDALSPLERFKEVPFSFFGQTPLGTPEQCASLVHDKTVLSFVRRDSPQWHPAFLDVCWRSKSLDKFPPDCVLTFCSFEKHSEQAFVQREVVRALLEAYGRIYRACPSAQNRAALLECRAHYIWRLQQLDAIYVPQGRAPGDCALLFTRAPYTSPSSNYSYWSARSGACMSLPRLPAHKSCLQEPTQCDISLHSLQNSCGAIYRSQVCVEMDEKHLWRSRKGPAPPCFPDSFTDSISVASTDSTEATSVSSDTTSSDSQKSECVQAAAIPRNVTCHEERVCALPEGFEYILRVKEEDEIEDSSGTLAEIDHILVAKMLGRRKRNVSPLRHAKKRKSAP